MITRARIIRAAQAQAQAADPARAAQAQAADPARAAQAQAADPARAAQASVAVPARAAVDANHVNHGVGGRLPRGRVLAASVVRAQAEAADMLASARAQAQAILEEAELTASNLRRTACEEAKQEAAGALSAAWLRLRREEATKDERDLERTIELARALAERLLGQALELDPDRILELARQALAFVRQSRAIRIFAHPQDAEVLARRIATLGLEPATVQIEVAADRPRGSLLLRTDLGTIDADIAIQLDRLTRALLDDSRHGR